MKYHKIWLPLLSIVLFVGLAEMICRIFDLSEKLDADFKFITRDSAFYGVDYIQEDPFLMWSLKPGRNYGDASVIINAQGLRGREYKIKKDRNVFRILCLGDSSTFGVHVQSQETYAALLEDRLNGESGGRTRYEVINAGVEGYTSCQGLAFYKLKGYEYAPDIVTFYFGWTDDKKKYSLSDRQLLQKDSDSMKALRADLENHLLLRLHAYRIFRKYINRIFGKGENNTFEKVTRVPPEDYKENILELNRLCRQNKTALVLISPPVAKEGFPLGYVLPYRALLESISKEYGIPLVNIPEMTERSPFYTTPFFLDSVHPNPLGHKIIMQKIHDNLIAGKILPGHL
jgi:lysophospholipase L1-like esterase